MVEICDHDNIKDGMFCKDCGWHDTQCTKCKTTEPGKFCANCGKQQVPSPEDESNTTFLTRIIPELKVGYIGHYPDGRLIGNVYTDNYLLRPIINKLSIPESDTVIMIPLEENDITKVTLRDGPNILAKIITRHGTKVVNLSFEEVVGSLRAFDGKNWLVHDASLRHNVWNLFNIYVIFGLYLRYASQLAELGCDS